MVLDPATNLAATELTASVSDAATTFAVTDASVFPDAATEGAFNVLVWDSETNVNPVDAPDAEFVRVTATDTTADELTVQRGQENTTAASHPSGATVTDTWSAKDRDDIDTAFAGTADDPHGNEAHTETFAVDGDAQPPESHALGGAAHNADTLGNLNSKVSDATVESESGAQAKADDAEASAESYADSEIENHRTGETHTAAQPPETHDNTAHSEAYTTSGENVENFSTAGAAGEVPTSQGDGTLAMEPAGGGAIELITVAAASDLTDVAAPTIAYVEGSDTYAAAYDTQQ